MRLDNQLRNEVYPTDKLLKIIEQNKKDRLEEKVSTYNSFDEMMADLGKS